MIVSFHHGFAFVKTRKTAGTSVEIALSAVCGPRDLVAAIAPEDEQIRRGLGYCTAQNTALPMRGLGMRDAARWVVRRRRPEFWNHMPASQVRRAVGSALWEKLFAFTIERNPWDRAVSLYFWRNQNNSDPIGFSAFLRAVEQNRLSNFDVYSRGGQVCVDRILRYENLQDELSETWHHLGLPDEPFMVKAKASQRPSSTRDFRSMYADSDIQYVADVCSREIALMGYSF